MSQPVAEQLITPLWFTKQQAAAELGCDARTVRRLVLKGYLPCYGVGRLVRFKPADVAACLPLLTPAQPVAVPGLVTLDLKRRLDLRAKRWNQQRQQHTQPGGAA